MEKNLNIIIEEIAGLKEDFAQLRKANEEMYKWRVVREKKIKHLEEIIKKYEEKKRYGK